MTEPRKGLRFAHKRRIHGSPKAGTVTPVIFEVTRVTALAVYYREVEGDRLVGVPSYIDRPNFHTIVKRIL